MITIVILQTTPSLMDRIPAFIYITFVLTMVFGSSWRVIASAVNSRRATRWPTVMGDFFSGHVTRGGRSGFTATITYRYFQEEYQSGEYLKQFESEVDANAFVDSLRDRKIPVHYDPREPSRSSLIYEEL
jgi:Protein of unknown function (DUF3592)